MLKRRNSAFTVIWLSRGNKTEIQSTLRRPFKVLTLLPKFRAVYNLYQVTQYCIM